jgi:hypothetical protein
MFLAKLKLGTAALLCVGLLAALVGGSFTSMGFAQDGQVYPPARALVVRPAKTESDLDFIRRISKDLRGTDPTPAEIHFFVASKDAGRRQKLIDLFIQERQAKEQERRDKEKSVDALKEEIMRIQLHLDRDALVVPRRTIVADVFWAGQSLKVDTTAGLTKLQKDFYKELHAVKEKGDVAKITQAHLERLIDFVKTNPKSPDNPDAMRHIAFVYESQGKAVEADAWRDKLLKEYPKVDKSSPAK